MKYGTLYEAFQNAVRDHKNRECLGWIEGPAYRTATYGELAEHIEELARKISACGLAKGDRVAFMLKNGPAWVTVDLACASLGIITVPIHITYGIRYIEHSIRETEARIFFIEKELYDALSASIKELGVEHIVVVRNSNAMDFDMPSGARGRPQSSTVGEDDAHTIIYTSGTTGMPKGVMLSHKNLLHNVAGATEYIPIRPDDRFLSFLPLSHSLERTAGMYAPLLNGAAIYYARDKSTMKDDILKARPTILVAVPRVFEKVYDVVQDKATHGSSLKRWLFYKALDYGTKRRKNELTLWSGIVYRILDALVLKKIRASLGGRIRFTVSGGSALSVDIMQFFEDIGILILEGYGLTETSPVVATNGIKNYRFGAVGKPIPGVEVKIASDGEILVRGESVMRGYYKNEEATTLAFDADGWFLTGDLGEFDSDGYLKITGRKKEMIVLSTGKNVAPVPLEQELETNRFISQAMVYGDNQKHISALIVPDFDELARWADEQGVECILPDILADERTAKLYERELTASLDHFPEYEQVRVFKLIVEEFSQENDMLTPTLKLKRKNIMERYIH